MRYRLDRTPLRRLRQRMFAHAAETVRTRPFIKLGGDCYLTGNVALLMASIAARDVAQGISAVMFIGTSTLFRLAPPNRFARTNHRFAIAAGASIAGLTVLNAPALVEAVQQGFDTLPIAKQFALAGTALFNVGAGIDALDALRPRLLGAYKVVRHGLRPAASVGTRVVASLLGRQRGDLLGTTSALSKGFLLVDSISSQNVLLTGILCTWLAGDLLIRRSTQPRAASLRAAALAQHG